MLNSSYNKTVYTALMGAVFLVAAALCSQFNVQIKPELWAALQALAQAAVPLFVPNKEV